MQARTLRDYVEVDLLQARAGDANGDHVVDVGNDGSALVTNLGGTYGPVSAGEGDGYVDRQGNIFLEMDRLALYSV